MSKKKYSLLKHKLWKFFIAQSVLYATSGCFNASLSFLRSSIFESIFSFQFLTPSLFLSSCVFEKSTILSTAGCMLLLDLF